MLTIVGEKITIKTMELIVGFLLVSVLFGCGSDSITGSVPVNIPDSMFSTIQENVFTPACATSNCHNGSETPNLTAGRAYNSIVNVRSSRSIDFVEPGDADNSYLYRKLTGVGIEGDRMPKGRGSLSAAVIDSIRVWIEDGALNN